MIDKEKITLESPTQTSYQQPFCLTDEIQDRFGKNHNFTIYGLLK